MDKQKVIITGTVGVVSPQTVQRFRELIQNEVPEASVEFLFDLPVSDEELIKKAQGATVIISQYQPMSEAIYKGLAPELRGFVANGIGTNAAAVPVATELGLVVANVPDYCQDEVASHTLSLILACQRNLKGLIQWIDGGNWGGGYKQIEGRKRFAGSKVGLFGFGRIPRRVAEMLAGFEVEILAHDPYLTNEAIQAAGARPVTFDQLLEESDFISLHAPLVPSTEKIMNADAFGKMKKTACLINTSRGGLVDPQALYEALVNKEIEFAALDVLISEPPAGIEKELLSLPNALVTPHVAYYSTTAMSDLVEKVAQESVRILQGKQPKNVVNRDVLPKLTWINE